jgi:hypothetical protein
VAVRRNLREPPRAARVMVRARARPPDRCPPSTPAPRPLPTDTRVAPTTGRTRRPSPGTGPNHSRPAPSAVAGTSVRWTPTSTSPSQGPHAPGGRSTRARSVPDLRHGARAADDLAGRRSEPRARRHEAPVHRVGRVHRAAVPPGDGLDARPDPHRGPLAALQLLLQLVLATPVVLWGGWPFFQRGWASVVNRHLNMFTLIALGTGAAYLYSLARATPSSLSGAVLPATSRRTTSISRPRPSSRRSCFSARSSSWARATRTGGAIRALLGLAPKTARRLGAGGADEDVPIENVKVGDRLRVRPGEKVPVDGASRGDERGGRVDAHRRARPGDQEAGRHRDGRDRERKRRARRSEA